MSDESAGSNGGARTATQVTANGDVTAAEFYERGIAARRAVLGDAHVDRSLQSATEFNSEIQELVTRYCWGEVWNRPGLPRQTRSMLNLAMLTALNRGHELRLHVRGAINNGVSPDEIKEVLLQTAIYVGVPAALEAFRIAADELGKDA